MENVIFNKIYERDLKTLTEISKKAFHTDHLVGCDKKEGGPPGYDSKQFHMRMMKISKAFYKIVYMDTIIGGFWIMDKGNGHYYFARIFLDPVYHKKGIGLQSFEWLFNKYPDATKWTLETPPWNIRTRAFYTKLGFQIIKETDDDVFFERTLP
jgi:RimJ/RimL family protein N-acetyltransferase